MNMKRGALELRHVPRVFVRALALWLVVSVFLGALGSLVIPSKGLPIGAFVSATASSALLLFAVGLPFCCLVVALIVSRRLGDARSVIVTGLFATLMASGLWFVAIPVTESYPVAGLRSLLGERTLDAHDVLRFHTGLALSVLPFLLTVLGLLIARLPIKGGPRRHPLQVVAAAIVGLVVFAPIGARHVLFGTLPPILIGWAPSFIAVVAIGVLAVPFLRRGATGYAT